MQDAKISYLTTDHLGSPRIITDAIGAVISRKDFTAFGEDVVTPDHRKDGSTGNGYDPPNVRQDYTGYQKDGESGLEFAQARYYNTDHGRFTSVDPLTASASIRNPQTFNRYSYVANSPYEFVDPLGLFRLPTPEVGDSGVCKAESSSCSYGGSDPFAAEKELQTRNDQPRRTRSSSRGKRRKAVAKKSGTPPKVAPKPTSPTPVEVDTSNPKIAAQNAAFADVLTDGNGIARTADTQELYYGDAPSHFMYKDGLVFGVHVYGDETGDVKGNIFIPEGFKATWVGGTDDTVRAAHPNGDIMYIFHVSGVSSTADLERNMRTQNAGGSRLIGQTGGRNGDRAGYIHSCIKLFRNQAGYDDWKAAKTGNQPLKRESLADMRKYLK